MSRERVLEKSRDLNIEKLRNRKMWKSKSCKVENFGKQDIENKKIEKSATRESK